MGPDIYPRGAHVICTPRIRRGAPPRRAHRTAFVAFQLGRRAHLDPRRAVSHELHLRPEADLGAVSQAVATPRHAPRQGPRGAISSTEKRAADPPAPP